MADPPLSFLAQVRRNAVALISLAVALSSLGYNAWRNEATEHNRNVRTAGFEILIKLGDLQQVVFFSHYDKDTQAGNPRLGWAYVLGLQDLSQVMPAPVPGAAVNLHRQWEQHWEGLRDSQTDLHAIEAAVDGLRQATLQALAGLD